jgi:hypothetical protein
MKGAHAAPSSKGVVFLSRREFVRVTEGPAAWPTIVARLDADDRAALDAVVAVGWYPTEMLFRLSRAIVASRPSVASQRIARQEMGRFVADHQLTTIYRLFLRAASPTYILDKIVAYWSRVHDHGEWTVDMSTGQASASLRGFSVDAEFCVELTAYVARMFELTGAKNVTVAHPECRGRGAPACTFSGSWKP